MKKWLKQLGCLMMHSHFPQSRFRVSRISRGDIDFIARFNMYTCTNCGYSWRNTVRGTEIFTLDGDPMDVWNKEAVENYNKIHGPFYWLSDSEKKELGLEKPTIADLGLPCLFAPMVCDEYGCPPIVIEEAQWVRGKLVVTLVGEVRSGYWLRHIDGRDGYEIQMNVPCTGSASSTVYLTQNYEECLQQLEHWIPTIHNEDILRRGLLTRIVPDLGKELGVG